MSMEIDIKLGLVMASPLKKISPLAGNYNVQKEIIKLENMINQKMDRNNRRQLSHRNPCQVSYELEPIIGKSIGLILVESCWLYRLEKSSTVELTEVESTRGHSLCLSWWVEDVATFVASCNQLGSQCVSPFLNVESKEAHDTLKSTRDYGD
ncbi:hypothetical protein TIFTF001_037806 [Ficus carica]|uniref:Uncharacterized protein n=1 Tax=Ficus carica TaxID=3494 RepID=A0AA88E615_FICCA|nr:hypothetical protein TIFTF001_037806 [Ficus carica]